MSVSTRLFKQSNRLPKYRPLPWRTYLHNIIAKDPVLWIAAILAATSTLLTRPNTSTLAASIDAKTLACLACLMTASGGLMLSGAFDAAAEHLAATCHSTRSLTAALTAGTFASSMLITNDVALIVFVPIALLTFRQAKQDATLTVILQTLAANAGSILLPMGNPQNLYIYSRYSLSFPPFLRTVLPLSLAGAALLALLCLRAKKAEVPRAAAARTELPPKNIFLYSLLFLLSVMAVFDMFDYRAALALSAAAILAKGRALAQQVDWALLATFVFFFVFVGNIAAVPAVHAALTGLVAPHPYAAAAAASQLISNVPAAVLLSGFTDDARALLAGVSAGGFGTPVASMASLISYKLFVRDGGARGRYLLLFTILNILFLAAMTATYLATTGE